MIKKTLGIVGGGQLGRMLAEAAQRIKISTIVLDPTPESPAGQVSQQIVGGYKDPKKIIELAKRVKFLTFEIEGANSKIMKRLTDLGAKINPSPQTLEMIQDKLSQKQFLLANNLPIAQFTSVENEKDIKKAARYLGFPLILKARFHGFDGRGNAPIKSEKDIKSALKKLHGQKLYLEKFISFKKELAIQIVKGKNGRTKVYPLVQTFQKNSICHIVKFPALVSEEVQKSAIKNSLKIVSLLSGYGVFAVEMFETVDGKILINELAPRVHNSGHWTIEGTRTSQFENHVRAVCNLPLKSIKPKVKAAVMINILGERNGKANLTGADKIKKINGASIHIYGKKETRVERKMGHITVVGNDPESVHRSAMLARKAISI